MINKIKEKSLSILYKTKEKIKSLPKTIENLKKRAIVNNILNLTNKKLSDKNIIRITYLVEKIVKNEKYLNYAKNIRKLLKENHPFIQLIKKTEAFNPIVKKKLIKNLLFNSMVIGKNIRIKIKQKENWEPPFLLVIDVTDRCNLNCKGCWAGTYVKESDMSYELFDRILKEAKELGIYFITLTGGEPFIRKDILKIFKEHSDMFFQVYTNGTFITPGIAKELAKLGNVAPTISIEGFERETDERRGKGVHKKIMQAMDNLKKQGVFFGFSAMVTKHNSELVGSDEFIDFYMNKGCSFGWFFQYIPIGREPNVKLMPTPKQRNELRKIVLKVRATKPIFIGDFWNDGPFVKGCIAGARGGGYFHITNNGNVEPCVFAHFAVDNIKV